MLEPTGGRRQQEVDDEEDGGNEQERLQLVRVTSRKVAPADK